MSQPDRLRIAVVCGNKYTFRSIYVPLIRQLEGCAVVRLYLLDYPEDYDLAPLLEELACSGAVEEVCLIPDSRHLLRHHRAMARETRKLAASRLDFLLVDADFTPMHQYLIFAAREVGAKVIAIQKEPPTQLLALYARAISGVPLEKDHAEYPLSRPITAAFQRAIFGPHRPQSMARLFQETISRAGTEWRQTRRFWRNMMTYRILPFALIRRTFSLHPYEKNGSILFASSRVDAAVVYDERIRQAIRHFFPDMRVYTARHPLSALCRCRPETSRRNLLILLAGPWSYYITSGNSGQEILQRWGELILQALQINPCDEVHIRPHPRETGAYPELLANFLESRGLTCRILDPQAGAVADLVCDYAGVLGAASGALTEAGQACRRVFVIGVENIQGEHDWETSVRDYSTVVTCVPAGTRLSAEHFVRRRVEPENGKKEVGELIQTLKSRPT